MAKETLNSSDSPTPSRLPEQALLRRSAGFAAQQVLVVQQQERSGNQHVPTCMPRIENIGNESSTLGT